MNNRSWLTVDFNNYLSNKNELNEIIKDNNLIIKNYINSNNINFQNTKIININLNNDIYYNPFHFMMRDIDIDSFCNYLIIEKLELSKIHSILLQSLILYLVKYRPLSDQNFINVMKLLRASEVDENNLNAKSPLDRLFDEVERIDNKSIALKNYKLYQTMNHKRRNECVSDLLINLSFFELEIFRDDYMHNEYVSLPENIDNNQSLAITLEKSNILSLNIIYDLIGFQLVNTLNNEESLSNYYKAEKNIYCPKPSYNKKQTEEIINDKKNIFLKLKMISEKKTSKERMIILNSIKEEIPNWNDFIDIKEYDMYYEITPYFFEPSFHLKWDTPLSSKLIIVKI